jgi:hypothetical protein
MNYLIVLFKNKKRKKIINKFVKSDKAKTYFDKLKKDSLLINFEVKVENGKECVYELALLERNSLDFQPLFVKDELGRQLEINLDDSEYKIIDISYYKKEETVFHYKTKNKISFDFFVKRFLPKTGLKLISKINNKLVVQNDDVFEIFSCKSSEDSERFIESLEEFLIDNNRIDCLIVKDVSKQQKKYLYDLLEEQGVNKSFLYRTSTTYFRK